MSTGDTMTAVENDTPALFYRQCGTGTPVIALHGSASNSGQWMSLMAQFEGRHRVIAPDLPGYGVSKDVPASGRSPLRACARAIADLALKAGEPVHLVGHSYGGSVALKVAQIWPELVRSMTLIEPAAFHFLAVSNDADASLFAEIRELAGRMAASAACDDPHTAMRIFVDYWNGDGAWAAMRPELQSRLEQDLGEVLGNFSAGFAEEATLADVAAIACPVHFIMGLESQPVAQRVTDMLADAVTDGRLSLIAEAGHMAPVTHPEIVNLLIQRHVRTVEQMVESFAAPANDEISLNVA